MHIIIYYFIQRGIKKFIGINILFVTTGYKITSVLNKKIREINKYCKNIN